MELGLSDWESGQKAPPVRVHHSSPRERELVPVGLWWTFPIPKLQLCLRAGRVWMSGETGRDVWRADLLVGPEGSSREQEGHRAD